MFKLTVSSLRTVCVHQCHVSINGYKVRIFFSVSSKAPAQFISPGTQDTVRTMYSFTSLSPAVQAVLQLKSH